MQGTGSRIRVVALTAVLGLSACTRSEEPDSPPVEALADETDPGPIGAVSPAHSFPALTDAERAELIRVLDLRPASDGSGLVDGTCERPAAFTPHLLDLSGDGVEEILVEFGNTCTSGGAGGSLAIFTGRGSGSLQPVLMLPGLLGEVLESRTGGWSDLQIGGPGFCFPVWTWSGTEYRHDRNEPQAPGGCDHVG